MSQEKEKRSFSSRFHGVIKWRKRFSAIIYDKEKKRKWLGTFLSEKVAAHVYNQKRIELFGENDSKLNIISEDDRNENEKERGAKSKYYGVTKIRNKYRAQLYIHGKNRNLGTFNSSKDAAKKVNEKKKEIFGELAKRLNIISSDEEEI